jgi:hypothetical protein
MRMRYLVLLAAAVLIIAVIVYGSYPALNGPAAP